MPRAAAHKLVLSALALALPLAAQAGGGWDWDNKFQARHWRAATLQWAQQTHPDHPSYTYLQDHYDPPAEELWCHDPGTPDPIDYQTHSQILTGWLHYFLAIPPQNPLPQGLPAWPPECTE